MEYIMPHYPISLDLNGKKCVVIGGGSVGERKVEMLLEFGASVTVVAPEITPAIRELASQKTIRYVPGVYTPASLQGMFLVIAATSERGVNRAISEECQRCGILVNVADDPDLCTFFVPAIVRRGDFTIGVSTSGRSPALAKRVRESLESSFGPEYGELAEVMGDLRDEVKAKYEDPADRVRAYERILDSDVLDLLAKGKRDEAVMKARKCI